MLSRLMKIAKWDGWIWNEPFVPFSLPPARDNGASYRAVLKGGPLPESDYDHKSQLRDRGSLAR
jgi:hypothetical protein